MMFTQLVGNLFSKLLPPLVRAVLKPFARLVFPLNFKIFVLNEEDHIDTPIVSTHYRIKWVDGWHLGDTSTTVRFCVKPEVRLPFGMARTLYPDEEMTVFLIDELEQLGVLEPSKFPGRPARYELFRGVLKPNVVTHLKAHVRPRQHFEYLPFPLWIYYRGRRYTPELFVAFPSPPSVTRTSTDVRNNMLNPAANSDAKLPPK